MGAREDLLAWCARQAKEQPWLASSYWWPLPKVRVILVLWLAWKLRLYKKRHQLLGFAGALVIDRTIRQLRESACHQKRRSWRDMDAYHLASCEYCHARLGGSSGKLLSPSSHDLSEESVTSSRGSHVCLQAIVSRASRRLSVCFQGAGAVLVYHMGVAAYFQQHFDLRSVALLGASGGSLAATCLAIELDMDYVRCYPIDRTAPSGAICSFCAASHILTFASLGARLHTCLHTHRAMPWSRNVSFTQSHRTLPQAMESNIVLAEEIRSRRLGPFFYMLQVHAPFLHMYMCPLLVHAPWTHTCTCPLLVYAPSLCMPHGTHAHAPFLYMHQAVENDFRSILPSDDDVRRMCDGQLFISLTQVRGQDACMRPPALRLSSRSPRLAYGQGHGLVHDEASSRLAFPRSRT